MGQSISHAMGDLVATDEDKKHVNAVMRRTTRHADRYLNQKTPDRRVFMACSALAVEIRRFTDIACTHYDNAVAAQTKMSRTQNGTEARTIAAKEMLASWAGYMYCRNTVLEHRKFLGAVEAEETSQPRFDSNAMSPGPLIPEHIKNDICKTLPDEGSDVFCDLKAEISGMQSEQTRQHVETHSAGVQHGPSSPARSQSGNAEVEAKIKDRQRLPAAARPPDFLRSGKGLLAFWFP